MIATSPFFTYADNVMKLRYSHIVQGRKEEWDDITERVVEAVVKGKVSESEYCSIYDIIAMRKFIPGGRILSQAGREYHQTDNCFTLGVEDTREGWAELAHKTTMMFMSGGGCGVDYSQLRGSGSYLGRSGGVSSGPIPLIHMINGIGAAARQGGERRGAIYASLRWDHPDIQQFIQLKNGNDSLKHTNISVRFNKEWKDNIEYSKCGMDDSSTFYRTLQHACQWGDPGFQFDDDEQVLRNACTEIISNDDSDSCCLGSINLSKITSLSELSEVTNLAILFLLCNTLYTDCPTPLVKQVKERNRRIGLGLMGVSEWFLQRSLAYGENECIFDDRCIETWLSVWENTCEIAALQWSNMLSIARPIATRAIAPTGTISIAGGHTTPGIEPIFHTAYQRCYNTPSGLVREIVIDPIVQKMVDEGYDVRDIDTAYTLSKGCEGIERRIAFQALMQRYVDNAISSTVNLPPYVQGIEDVIAPILLKYLPSLRGITFYPDGRHDNQPVVPVELNDALALQDLSHSKVQVEQYPSCKGEGCGL